MAVVSLRVCVIDGGGVRQHQGVRRGRELILCSSGRGDGESGQSLNLGGRVRVSVPVEYCA